jgi:hypothetical protein
MALWVEQVVNVWRICLKGFDVSELFKRCRYYIIAKETQPQAEF